MQLIVFGMHRSGTSPLTRLMNLMGAYVGIEGSLIGANNQNPKGFWERKDVLELNKQVLSSLGLKWYQVANLDLSQLRSQVLRSFRRQAMEILLKLEPHRPWIIKEPRMCLLFPLWRELLETPVCIHIYRHPVEVARSLHSRNGFPLHFGVALWEKYHLAALANTQGLPRILVSHRLLMTQPVETLRKLYEELVALGGYGVRYPREEEIRAFIDLALYREREQNDPEEQLLNIAQKKLLDEFRQGTVFALDPVPQLSAGALEALTTYSEIQQQKDNEQESSGTSIALPTAEGEAAPLRAASRGKPTQTGAPPQNEREEGRLLVGGERTPIPQLPQHEMLSALAFYAALHSQKVIELERALEEKDRWLSMLRTELRQREQDIDKFQRWIERLDRGFSDVLQSKRWKLGHSLAAFYRRLGGKPPLPMPQEHQRRIMKQVCSWREAFHRRRPLSFNGAPMLSPSLSATASSNLQISHSAVARPAPMNYPTVDIVICIHNALDDVKACLTSVLEHTKRSVALYLVNDGSDEATTVYLRQFAASCSSCVLLENPTAEGYTKAANRGLRASTADYVVLLNSDTVVPTFWLDKLIECGESDSRIGVIGPLSNAASWQSLPERYSQDGKWAVNALPEGYSVNDMAQLVEAISKKRFPRVPFVNGFCFAIKRAVISAVGYLDEEAFPEGYGEENDYCLRVARAGYTLGVADHGYVYHAKSKSYAPGDRARLVRAGWETLLRKYGDDFVKQKVDVLRHELALEDIRKRVRAALHERSHFLRPEGRFPLKVLFLLPVRGDGGGVHSVVQEAHDMGKIGVYARVAIPRRNGDHYHRLYQGLNKELFLSYDSEEALLRYASGFDVVVATIFTSVKLLARVCQHAPHIYPAYYIQDYEPWIVNGDAELAQEAKESYTLIPDMLCFAKTTWLANLVAQKHEVSVAKVEPSLDTSIFYPRLDRRMDNRAVRIAAMVRPRTPRRAPLETMQVLQAAKRRYGERVAIVIFGCDAEDPGFLTLPRDFAFEHYGPLIREEVAELLREAEIFLDCSRYQAFGRTGLEAMACGCATILPANCGTSEYARHRENSLLVNTEQFDDMLAAVQELVEDPSLRQTLSRSGLATAARYSVRASVISEVNLFLDALRNRRSAVGVG